VVYQEENTEELVLNMPEQQEPTSTDNNVEVLSDSQKANEPVVEVL
jgi:hypothetical protein